MPEPERTLIAAASVLGVARGARGPGWVEVTGEAVTASGHGPCPGEPDLVLADGHLVPGLVDAQLNGAFGTDFADASPADFARIAHELTATGTTSVVPTFITAPVDELVTLLGSYGRVRSTAPGDGARLLPCHVEGPFLSSRRRGAHREHLLVDPTSDLVRALVEASPGDLGYVTLAPERDGAIDAVRQLATAGVAVAVGHSDAGDDVVRAAADAGATLVTHLYNAQRPLHHRDPGVVGAGLADPRLTLGLIVDLHHVEPTAVRLAFAAAGGRVMLVTDAVAALGMPPGTYELGGEALTVADGSPPLRADGTIAGSAVRMDDAVAHTVSCGIDLATAVDAATRVPADALGRPDLGRLSPGTLADLVWLDDGLRCRATWIGGRLVWSDPTRPLDPEQEQA
ncbi:MAG: N-acetylglucosamine-6-phosphate deacetylase [Nocardioidaceae bacterium]|nr:N-acetylglucosamine-6-phosphate deacetylase [Nocardioidaceae bacterium]